jgi:hypothetical protein
MQGGRDRCRGGIGPVVARAARRYGGALDAPAEAIMETLQLGNSSLRVGRLGLGCMGMSEFYGPADEAESIRTLHGSLDLGVNFLDTADM